MASKPAAIWARAERGGEGLTVETPAAAAAIRGTDWSMTVDGSGKTSLIVLEGQVELSNEFGSVSVAAGEGAVASIGRRRPRSSSSIPTTASRCSSTCRCAVLSMDAGLAAIQS